MTISELMEVLFQFPQDLEVMFHGYIDYKDVDGLLDCELYEGGINTIYADEEDKILHIWGFDIDGGRR